MLWSLQQLEHRQVQRRELLVRLNRLRREFGLDRLLTVASLLAALSLSLSLLYFQLLLHLVVFLNGFVEMRDELIE